MWLPQCWTKWFISLPFCFVKWFISYHAVFFAAFHMFTDVLFSVILTVTTELSQMFHWLPLRSFRWFIWLPLCSKSLIRPDICLSVRRRPVTKQTHVTSQGQSMWDLWWTKWHWYRFFSLYFLAPQSASSHNHRRHAVSGNRWLLQTAQPLVTLMTTWRHDAHH